MYKVDLLLECNDIVSLEIDSFVLAPKAGMKAECGKHKLQTILKVSVPYHTDHKKFTRRMSADSEEA